MFEETYNLVTFCNASYANLNHGSSQGGLIVFLNGKDGNISPLCWNSKKMKRVFPSTIAAETMALLEASETCFWLSHIINEMLDIPLGITKIYCDNKSLTEVAHSNTAVEEKRLRVDLAAIRQSISRNEFKLRWIKTKHQLADSLTKQGADSSQLVESLESAKF